MAGIKDVAKHAGVSISTVSNAIRGTKFVSEPLKTRIQKSIDTLGYEVNPIASSLKSKSTNTIGVLVTNIHRIFFPRVIRGIQDELAAAGCHLVLHDSDDSIEKEKAAVNLMRSSWVDGIILDSVAGEEDEDYLNGLAGLVHLDKPMGVVSIERRFDAAGIDSVVVNNRRGGALVTRHLLEKQCASIVFIAGPENSCMVRDRLDGCRETLRKSDPTARLHVVAGDFSPYSGYAAIRGLLAEGFDFDGVFAANDQMAIGALNALREADVQVPNSVRVAGFDNSFVASLLEPGLTTVRVPKYDIGREAARLLLRRIADPAAHARVIELPVELVVRGSTDAAQGTTWDLTGW